jgi:hypothetical protein
MEVSGQLHAPATLPLGKSYPSARRLGGPQSQSGCCGEEKNLAPAGNRTPAFQPIAHRYTSCTVTIPWNLLNDPGISASTAWAWICHCSRSPFQYFTTMYTQFAGLPCRFRGAGPSYDLLSAWIGGSPKRPSFPNVRCAMWGHALLHWRMMCFFIRHLSRNACHNLWSIWTYWTTPSFLSGHEIIQYSPLGIPEKYCSNSSS